MKIENVETHLIRLPYTTGGAKNLTGVEWTTLDYVLVRIDTDAGISGWGDGFGYFAAPATKAALDHMIAPLLIGRDARNIRGLMRDLQIQTHLSGRYGVTMFALSGVDIALWDIAGKAAGMPLHQLLGGARRTNIPAYASLFKYGDPEQVGHYTAKAVKEGFKLVKLHETTVPAVRAAREAAGNGVPIMVDTNCPWTPHQALEMALAFRPYDLHWLEEPIFPPEDFESLSRLQVEADIPLAAGENACTAFEFQRMIEADAVSYLQPSVTKVGGITEFLKIINLAEAQGFTVMPHAPYFAAGFLASLHLLATLPDESLAEFFFYETLEASLYGDAIRPHDGIMVVPTGPGLGHDPDPAVIKEYGAKD
jgi:L-alanine-DL-glutamate epimerase-like enolase superfamily enzyme